MMCSKVLQFVFTATVTFNVVCDNNSMVANETAAPTDAPTPRPTPRPTAQPTAQPTAEPTEPTNGTVASPATPTATPTAKPTAQPTPEPTPAPPEPNATVASPTATPTALPTAKPTATPTGAPTAAPSEIEVTATISLTSVSSFNLTAAQCAVSSAASMQCDSVEVEGTTASIEWSIDEPAGGEGNDDQIKEAVGALVLSTLSTVNATLVPIQIERGSTEIFNSNLAALTASSRRLASDRRLAGDIKITVSQLSLDAAEQVETEAKSSTRMKEELVTAGFHEDNLTNFKVHDPVARVTMIMKVTVPANQDAAQAAADVSSKLETQMKLTSMGNQVTVTASTAVTSAVPTAAPTATPTSTPSPAPPTGPALAPVKVTLVVAGVDFAKLTADKDLKAAFVQKIKDEVAKAAGDDILSSHCAVELADGSVVATVTITPPDGVDSADVSKALGDAEDLATTVVTQLKAIEGIDAVTSGEISVKITIGDSTPAPTSDPVAASNAVKPYVSIAQFLVASAVLCEFWRS